MFADLRHTLRSLAQSPASAAAAAGTLALVLGVGASIFALVDNVLWTPLPFDAPQALVFAGEIPIGEARGAPRPISLPTFDAWTDQSRELFEALEAFDATNVTLTGLGSATRMGANHVTPGFFRMLGVFPLLGRIPRDIDRTSKVALISHRLWQGKLGPDPGVLGRTLVIGAEPHSVIGVLSDGCLSKRT